MRSISLMTFRPRATAFPPNRTLTALLLAGIWLIGFLGETLAQWVPNTQEQQIANYLAQTSGQLRPALIFDPVIAQVARERAQDMARRKYFAHLNPDGVAANYLLRQAGYTFPDWWGTDPTANYVESIAAGRVMAADTWNDWMNSAPHKTHLLGLDPFYAEQTHYGIGYAADSASPYKYYWVVITAPPSELPNLSISAPAGGTRLLEPQVTVSGTTSLASNAVTVEARIENADGTGAYSAATGTTTWAATLGPLAPGANTIRARSRRLDGSVIAEATIAVTYVQMGNVTVTSNGSGSVTSGFAGTTAREVGKTFSITATPAAGYLFQSWSGDVSSSSRTLSFTAADGLQIQANFVENILLSAQGAYRGLIEASDVKMLARFSVTSTGALTGTLRFASNLTASFKGQFDGNGLASVVVPAATGRNAITLRFSLDALNASGAIIGSASDGIFSTEFSADRIAFSATNPTPLAGRYTVRLAPVASPSGNEVPAGNGFATLTVSKSGTATFSGRLFDQTLFSFAIELSRTNQVPVFIPISRSGVLTSGTITMSGAVDEPITGSLEWTRLVGGVLQRVTLAVSGSGFTPIASRIPVLQVADVPGNVVVGLDGGNLTDASVVTPLAIPVTLTSANAFVVPAPNAMRLTISASGSTGLVTGSFVHPLTKRTVLIYGILLQNQNAAWGSFLGTDESGAFSAAAGN